MRRCAICQKKVVKRDICNNCFHKWGNGGNYPAWLTAIIKIDRRDYDRACRGSLEACFSDAGLDMDGEKIIQE